MLDFCISGLFNLSKVTVTLLGEDGIQDLQVFTTELYYIEVARFKILSLPWFDKFVLVFLFSSKNLLLTFS